MADHEVQAGGVTLVASDDGDGIPVVLLHGLTASRRYVVMGSRRLQRSGHRVVAYDARGHGASSPAPAPSAYEYDDLAADLADLLEARGIERAVLAGASMGAHTILRFALEAPQRVAALAVITPGFDPDRNEDPERLAQYDALSAALRQGDLDAFASQFRLERVGERWRAAVGKVLVQRMAVHEHPEAVADALAVVPRSRPFESLTALEAIACPVVVVGSRDDSDPGHPLALAEAYAQALPGAQLRVEAPGESPLAWQGGQLSALIAELAARAW